MKPPRVGCAFSFMAAGREASPPIRSFELPPCAWVFFRGPVPLRKLFHSRLDLNRPGAGRFRLAPGVFKPLPRKECIEQHGTGRNPQLLPNI